jgi:hypothetical protein
MPPGTRSRGRPRSPSPTDDAAAQRRRIDGGERRRRCRARWHACSACASSSWTRSKEDDAAINRGKPDRTSFVRFSWATHSAPTNKKAAQRWLRPAAPPRPHFPHRKFAAGPKKFTRNHFSQRISKTRVRCPWFVGAKREQAPGTKCSSSYLDTTPCRSDWWFPSFLKPSGLSTYQPQRQSDKTHS